MESLTNQESEIRVFRIFCLFCTCELYFDNCSLDGTCCLICDRKRKRNLQEYIARMQAMPIQSI